VKSFNREGLGVVAWIAYLLVVGIIGTVVIGSYELIKRYWVPIIIVSLLFMSACCTGGSMELRKKYAMLHSVVHLSTSDGSGSGVVIYSNTKGADFSLILTAKHVIRDGFGEISPTVNVTVFPEEEEYVGRVIKVSKDYDLALVRIDTALDFVATRGNKEVLPIFTRVHKIGCGLGTAPFPTSGQIAQFGNHAFRLMVTSPIIFGDSGGGIFTEIDGELRLIGIVSAVASTNRGMVVPHMGIIVNIFAIEQFLGKKK
jgi:S1-C subfamily serine protease